MDRHSTTVEFSHEPTASVPLYCSLRMPTANFRRLGAERGKFKMPRAQNVQRSVKQKGDPAPQGTICVVAQFRCHASMISARPLICQQGSSKKTSFRPYCLLGRKTCPQKVCRKEERKRLFYSGKGSVLPLPD